MRHLNLNKIFSTLMTVLVLLSTLSFTVEKHFCGDVLIDSAIFAEAKKCEKESLEVNHDKKCCKDITKVVKGQDVLRFSSFEDLELQHLQFLMSFADAYTNLFKTLKKEIIPHKHYASVILVKDIQVLFDVFLI